MRCRIYLSLCALDIVLIVLCIVSSKAFAARGLKLWECLILGVWSGG